MTYSAFIKKYVGKYANYDSRYPNQCVDLVNLYIRDVLGKTPIKGNGRDFQYNYKRSQFVWIPNKFSTIPKRGDIAVFGGLVGKYGHVDIVYSDSKHRPGRINFWSFSQNWPLKSRCRVIKHPMYFGCRGFLRKK